MTTLDLDTFKVVKDIDLSFTCDAGYTVSKDYLIIPHYRDGKVSVISLEKMKVSKVINLGFSIQGPLVLNPDGHTLYV